jgi:hypothetical protein
MQEDTAAQLDADSFAAQRLSNVADTWQGRELDPSRILGAQRHGEWFRSQPAQGELAGFGNAVPGRWLRGSPVEGKRHASAA